MYVCFFKSQKCSAGVETRSKVEVSYAPVCGPQDWSHWTEHVTIK